MSNGTDAAPPSPPENGGDSILVVDDEAHLRKILKFHLEASGFRVLVAEDGVQALEIAKREQPALILLDLMMPKMSGNEVCRELKVEPTTRFIPVIILTAKTGSEEKVRQMENGAQDYITKPFSLAEVLVRVKSMIAWSRMQRHANPLTGLPGNISIEEEMTRRIHGKERFAVLYADLDNFKPFNDHYGYHRGDQAIFAISRILVGAVREAGNRADFVGHIGGDDFFVVTTPDRAELVGRAILGEFERVRPTLIDAKDAEAGFIEVKNRMGEVERFPLVTLTIAAVNNVQREIRHVAEASDIAAELKRYGKRKAGNIFVEDRRGRIWMTDGPGALREAVELGAGSG
jgi:diguanylate cyclase (GGDEF)-like protein